MTSGIIEYAARERESFALMAMHLSCPIALDTS
jgi:hypothetical protein